MERRNCCLYFFVALVVTIQIVSGLFDLIVWLLPPVDYTNQYILPSDVFLVLWSFVSIITAVILIVGAILHKPELVFVHIVVTLTAAVIDLICDIVLVSTAYTPYFITWIVIAIIEVGLEYAVYLFYKNMEKGKVHDVIA